MLWWDRIFLALCHRNAILLFLYLRYVDDSNLAGEPLAPGTRWEEGPWQEGLGRMVIKPEKVQDDLQVPEDQRTMREIRKMHPSNDPNGGGLPKSP